MGTVKIESFEVKKNTLSEASPFESLTASDIKTYPYSGLISSGGLKQKKSSLVFEAKPLELEEIASQLRQDEMTNEVIGLLEKKYPQMNTPNILLLFFECMRLIIKSQGEEKRSRSQERLLFLERGKEVSKQYKSQGSSTMVFSLLCGIFTIVGAAMPIAGRLKGGDIVDFFGKFFDSVNKYKDNPESIFKHLGGMATGIGKMQEMAGQSQHYFSEHHRHLHQIWSDTHQQGAQDNSTANQEYQDEWRSALNFLHDFLQKDYEAAKANN